MMVVVVARDGRVHPDGGQPDGRPAGTRLACRGHAVLDVRPVQRDKHDDDRRVYCLCTSGGRGGQR